MIIKRTEGSMHKWVPELVGLLIGVGLGAGSLFITYNYSPTLKIYGFPFVTAAFQKEGTGWTDFVGPLTLPATVGNAVVAFVLPQIGLAVLLGRQRRKNHKIDG